MYGWSGNKQDWAAVYIFLKLMADGNVYASNQNMRMPKSAYFHIAKITREEVRSQKYEYYPGKKIKIFLNGREVPPLVDAKDFARNQDLLWKNLSSAVGEDRFVCEEVEAFLRSIHVEKLHVPVASSHIIVGQTEDYAMGDRDEKRGIHSVDDPVCKLDFLPNSTLFPASGDNTNFIFEVIGNVDDALMDEFNGLVHYRKKKNRKTGEIEIKSEVAIGDRMRYLKDQGCDLQFHRMCVDNAQRNLVLSGGAEMPLIVANMLKAYYFDGEGKAENSSLLYALGKVMEANVAGYRFDDTDSIYYRKLGTLLYDMFTGMRLSSTWDGRSSVNGGYIVAQNDGEVLAYHSCMADEFKDFLIGRLGFESPSTTRHKYMEIYKEDDKYYLKLNLQIRFKG